MRGVVHQIHYVCSMCVGVMMVLSMSGCSSHSLVTPPLQPAVQKTIAIHPSTERVLPELVQPQRFHYQVKKGDTLWSLSKTYGIALDEIVMLNHLDKKKHLEIGQDLLLVKNEPHSAVARIPYEGGPLPPAERNFIWPVKGSLISHFHDAVHGVKNKGIDIQAAQGTPVVAAKSGMVFYAAENVRGYGSLIVVQHDDGYQTVYGYGENILVKEKDIVKQGDTIVHVGKSGRAVGAQLHFEIRKQGKAVNPLNYLK